MTDRERAIKAIRRGVPLGEVVLCSCHSTPPRRSGCFGVCEDSVQAIIASYEDLRRETPIGTAQGVSDCGAWDANATEAQVNSACMSYRHDFGIMPEGDRNQLRFEAREWLHAWQKEGIGADRNEIIERCAQVVDQANREGPYEAIASAKRIRALKGSMVSSTPRQTLPSEMLYTPEEAEPHVEGAGVTSTPREAPDA